MERNKQVKPADNLPNQSLIPKASKVAAMIWIWEVLSWEIMNLNNY